MAAQYHSGQQREPQRHQGPPPQQHQHRNEHDNPPGGRSQAFYDNQQPMDRYGNQQVLGQQHPHQPGVDYQPPQHVQRQQYRNQDPLGQQQQQPQYGNQESMSRQHPHGPGLQQQPQYGNQEPMGRQQPQHGNQEPIGQQQPQYGNQGPMGRQQPQHSFGEPMLQQQPPYGNQGPIGRQQPQNVNQGQQKPQYGNQAMGRQQPQHGNQQQPPFGVPYQEPVSRQQLHYGNQENIVQQQPQYDNQQAAGQNSQNGNQRAIPQQSHYGNQQGAPPVPRLRQKSLPRSISSTDLEKTSQCRSVIQQDWVIQAPPGGTNFFATVPIFTLTLPNLDAYPPDFQQFVFDRLIDKGVQQNLEQEKCLNWCRSATRLVPLITTGDGNCLLHSASLSMWGFQDRNFALRRAVHTALANSSSTQLHRRWKHSRGIENLQMGIELEDHQWDKEWRMVVSQASLDTPHGQPLESLDDFHIFVLANVLRRPIIMYAAPKIRSQATGGTLQQINFHGIYLPLLWESSSCKKNPLPLAYIGGHFVALVAIEYHSEYSQGMFTLPLTDVHGEMLPVRFTLKMEEPPALIMDYLRTTRISSVGDPFITSKSIVCAQLSIAERPAYLKPLLSGFINACSEAHFGNQPQKRTGQPQPYDSRQPNPAQPKRRSVHVSSSTTVGDQDRPKCIDNCGSYGDPEKAGMCSRCYKNYQAQQPQQSARNEEDMFYSKQSSPQKHENNQKCINHCGMQGDPHKGGLCYQCHEKQLRNEQDVQHGGQQQQQFRQNFQPSPPNGGQKCINDCGAYADPGSEVGMCSGCLQKERQVASATERKYSQNELNAPPQQNFSNGGGNSPNNSGSIKCPKCSNPGHPNYLGMCETCYQGGSLDPSPGKDNHIYETIPGPPNTEQPPIAQDRNARKNCPTPNCEFFGTADTLFYCSKCFERDMERILKEVDQSPAQGFQAASQPQAPPPKPAQFEQRIRNVQQQHIQPSAQPHRNVQQQPPQPSAQSHCADGKCPQCRTFYADQEYGGLCSTCFMEKTKTETRTEQFVQKPIYEQCQTKDCANYADVHGLCNVCVTNQLPRQKTAPVYQPQYEKCMNIDCRGLRTQNGFCDNCNMHTSRTYAATQQHPVYPQQSERPIPKPRRNTQGTRGMATAPIMHLNAAMEGMSVSGGGTQCFVCTGNRDTGSNVLCRTHAEITQKMLTQQHPVMSTPQGQPTQPNYQQQLEGRMQGQGGVPLTQGGPQYGNQPFLPLTQGGAQYGNQPFTGQNQGLPPHGRGISYDQYENPPQQQQQRAPPHQIQDPGYVGAQGGYRNHLNQQALSPDIPPRPSQGEVPFGVNMEPPRQQTVGGAVGGAVGGGGGAFEKLLCATPGCSFKGYRDLRNLCPDCYEETTRLKAPDKFPLV